MAYAVAVSLHLDALMDVVLDQVRTETRWQSPGVQALLARVVVDRPQPEFNRMALSGCVVWAAPGPWVLGHGRLPMTFDGVSMPLTCLTVPYDLPYQAFNFGDAVDTLLRAWRHMVLMLREVDALYVPRP